MKGFNEYLKTFLFLALAAWLAFYLTATFKQPLDKLASHLNTNIPLSDPKVLLPFLTPLLYAAERFLAGLISFIPGAYKLPGFDKKPMFIGTYLSLPEQTTELNIFKIGFDSLGAKYKLNGYVYNLQTGKKVIGDWKSDKLELKTAEPVELSYIYEGERSGKSPVRGYTYIKFSGESPQESQNGYWVDVDNVGTADWKRSHYVKLTAQIKKKIIPKAIFFDREFPYLYVRRLINRPGSIFKHYYANRDELKDLEEFQRPV